MELINFESRVLVKHYWKQDYKAAAAAARRICEVGGDGVVSECVAQLWFQRFNTGEENKDLTRSGIPKVLVACQKTLVHQKVSYIARLRHLGNHTEAVCVRKTVSVLVERG